MATNVEILTIEDITAIEERGGKLDNEQRQRAIAFINSHLGMALKNWVDSSIEVRVSRIQIVPEGIGLISSRTIQQQQIRTAQVGELPSDSIESFKLIFTPTVLEPEIVDLGMTAEYAQDLANGRDPLQENAFAQVLIDEGIAPADAQRVAPLIAKEVRSLQDQAIVTEVWRKWCALKGYDLSFLEEAS